MTIIKTITQFKDNIKPNSAFWYFLYENNQPVKIEKAVLKDYIGDDEVSLKNGFFADFGITPKISGFLTGTPVYLNKSEAMTAFKLLKKA
jgi:hypothetical protein